MTRRYENELWSSGILLFHCKDNKIINNVLTSDQKAGISLSNESSNNLIQANSICNYERGIEIYYNSNNNEIINNEIFNNKYGIRFDKTSNNIIYMNNFKNNVDQAYCSGNNSWCLNSQGNYWSDYKGEDTNQDGIGDLPYHVTRLVADNYPFVNEVPVIPADVPTLQIDDYNAPDLEEIIVNNDEVWENKTLELEGYINILNNCSLTLRNVTIISNRIGGRLFSVMDNAALSIYDSKIYGKSNVIHCRGLDSKLHIEFSELHGLGANDSECGISASGAEAIIINNLIRDSYAAIRFDHSPNLIYEIKNNNISDTRIGIILSGISPDNKTISENYIKNVIEEGVTVGSMKNSIFSDNTLEDIWGPSIIFWGAIDEFSNNILYQNNFINSGLPPKGHAGESSYWFYNEQGNYWSNYLDYYPNAKEHPSYTGVWDTPFTVHLQEGGEEHGDLYPLMNRIYKDTVVVAPMKVNLSYPGDKSDEIPIELNLSWYPSNRATSYRLQLASNSLFLSPIINQGGLTDTSFHVTGLEHETIYFWRVIANNIGVISDWSDTWNFTTLPELPTQVALIHPPNNAIIDSDSVCFNWQQCKHTATHYWFELSTDSLMTNPLVDSTLTETTTVKHELVNNQTYWWRVKAYNAAGWGSFSETWRLSILITGIESGEEIPKEFALYKNYPNPFNPTTMIKFSLPKTIHVSLKIYDILGKEVLTLLNEKRSAGRYEITFDASKFSSDVYFYRLQAGDFVDTKKCLLIR